MTQYCDRFEQGRAWLNFRKITEIAEELCAIVGHVRCTSRVANCLPFHCSHCLAAEIGVPITIPVRRTDARALSPSTLSRSAKAHISGAELLVT